MKIAILGGTGDIGQGLALRWALDSDHEILIGSRKAEKAAESAAEYLEILAERDVDARIVGHENAVATEGADVVVAAAPPEHVVELTETIAGGLAPDAILVSPAVSMERDEAGFHYAVGRRGSLTGRVAKAAPDDVPVVGAFHSLGARRLATLDADLGMDTLVVGDDEAARQTIIDLASEIQGLRGLDAGPLANAAAVEALTPLCITVGINNSKHGVGVRFV